MKHSILTTILILITNVVFSQIHWLINADKVPNCELIKKGKFINKEISGKSTESYYVVLDNNYITEFINDGEFFIKSKLEFTSDCSYKGTITEITIPDYNLPIGTIFYTEIIETATVDNLVKIKSSLENGKEYTLVWEKIAD